MHELDLTTWSRRSIYALYRDLDQPHIALTVEVDVTRFLARCRAAKTPVFPSMLFELTLVANTVPALRRRLRTAPERVVEHTHCDPAFTRPSGEDEGFALATVPFSTDPVPFLNDVQAVTTGPPRYEPFEDHRDDVLFLTCLPWLRFTALSHPTNRTDSIPRIAWGRITAVGDQQRMPVNLQVHHAVVDGADLGAFITTLQDRLNRE